MTGIEPQNKQPAGEFIDFADERYYVIRNVDRMAPFFVSVISDADHWLFVSSTGGLTAGRNSPDTALFPYTTVDKIHDSALNTGGMTIIRARDNGTSRNWEPFNSEHSGLYNVSRNLYKNFTGDKLCFEEINHDLKLTFRYTWATSEEFGFIRDAELLNDGDRVTHIEMLDGIQNILPAGTPRFAQSNTSNLVDAYKWTEIDAATGLAMYSLYSGITDRAEPCESLNATTTFCLGLEDPVVLLSSDQLVSFRDGLTVSAETRKRGTRGAYYAVANFSLDPASQRRWQIVADIEQSQSDCVRLRQRLQQDEPLATLIDASVAAGTDALTRIMASADGLQLTAEENVATHHYANVLFNVLRGGIFDADYAIPADDLRRTIWHFNRGVYERNAALLEALPASVSADDLLNQVRAAGDTQLLRLCSEYLPIRFGRRHGDPSRPWNLFSIKLQNPDGSRLLSYEGNWRDIFQNWEALTFSYPQFVESVIAKFVNASTMDGYNPYRITKEGIDWEVEEPDDPWSYIGYWGDHQIIYLQKLLELSRNFHPERLGNMLYEPLYSYANVPYRIRGFEALLANPKETVDYDEALEKVLEERVAGMGADGKLVLDANGAVYQVSLLEKLLVPLLAKLSNFVVDGGIWLNTQRPEWNDANNALVGQGLSMVTLYYLRRYMAFLTGLLQSEDGSFELSAEVAEWFAETAAVFNELQAEIDAGPVEARDRMRLLRRLGEAAGRYRSRVYAQDGFSGRTRQDVDAVRALLANALQAVDHSVAQNRRDDGLYHAYNLLDVAGDSVEIDTLYPMLEGQVAALSAGTLPPGEVVNVVDALFDSSVYREDRTRSC